VLGYPVPEKYVEEIKKVGLQNFADKLFNTNEIGQKQGTISMLTKDVYAREDLTEQAFVMALTKFVNGEIWR